MKNIVYLVALHIIGIEHKILHEIFKEKENYIQFYENLNTSNLLKYGFSKIKIDEIFEKKGQIDLKNIEKTLNTLNVDIITIHNPKYPKSLKNVFNIPYLLYIRGKIPDTAIAFVGSRQMTSYGEKAINKLVPQIGKYFNIVSGGAIGCDTESHIVALDNNIKTIAVVGTGIDKTYPKENKKLYEEIIDKGGAIISIFPLGTIGRPQNFPIRNEIIAGLSEGIVVIEAKTKSGSLITAHLGLELGKEVFALPGEIYKPNSQGCNSLIAKGEAKIIIGAEDILSEYDIIGDNLYDYNSTFLKDKDEKEIYELLQLEPLNIEQLSKKLSISATELLLKISILELSMLVKRGNNGKYEII